MKPNTIISILTAGDRIPWSGTVIDGCASVDESAVAGVSTPVLLEPTEGRNSALAGSLVLEGWLKIESNLNAPMYIPTEEDRKHKAAVNEKLDRERDKEKNRIAREELKRGLRILAVIVAALLIGSAIVSILPK